MADQSLPTATGIALHTGEKVSSSTSSTGGNCSSSTSKGKIISQAAAGSEKKKQQYRQSFQVSEKKKQQLTTTNSTSADSSQLRTGKQQQQQQQVRPSQLTTGKQHHPTATSSGHQSLTSRRSAISPHANINIDQIGGNQSGANNPNIAEEMVGSTASSNTGEERRSKEKLLRPSRGQEVHATTHMRVAREEKLTKSHSSSSYRNKIAHKNRGRDKDLSPPTNRQRHTAPSMAAHSTNDSAPSMGTLYLNTYARRNAKIPTAEEMNQAMQKMSLLGVGEDITGEEFTTYLDQLSCAPLPVDTSLVLDTLHVLHLYERHALYRIRAYKLAQGVPKEQLGLAELKACYTPDILEKEQYFCCYEEDGTLDWSFHPDYIELAELDDYQRLVPKNSSGNYGDLEYENWDEYREFFHSYEIEQEYLHYCEELSKKLEWLKEYLHVDMPLWGRISSRAAYQAIKIATGFPKISGGLAYTGYYELVQSMGWNDSWWKELDGVYFEIWRRVTKHKKIFRDALDEVYKLNRFPSRHHKMKRALEGNCSAMEKEFHICTANIDEEVSDDTAQELIAEAVQKRKEKPKYYEHYVRKKIQIAQAIGLIPEV